ncbi:MULTISPECIES: DUF2093 domain-containing protein [unclassified Roseitalea]|uniref:DUF2093 domain-containing protein n=1 Tax=unclassified Roseitalea TaxID=2639107 RepID=UPI00273FA83F|nr:MULTISPECIES: DUF2093 domain-containing protein [unclassified Roseitalea]
MNIHDIPHSSEARVRFLDADFRVITPGTFVRCAITGKPIPIDELRYWSVERQQAYVDVHASLEAERRAGRLPA